VRLLIVCFRVDVQESLKLYLETEEWVSGGNRRS